MGKMSELAEAVAELRHCGEVLIGVSETLTELFSGTGEAEPEVEKADPAPEKKEKPKEVKLSEVRTVLAEKSRQGFTAEVKELLQKYGAEKLSGVDASRYAELLTEAEVLGNG